MLIGISMVQLLGLLVQQLMWINLSFLQIASVRYIRMMMVLLVLFELFCLSMALLFGQDPGHSQVVLLRSATFGSSLGTLVNTLLASARREKISMKRLLWLGVPLLLTFGCLLGGIYGVF